MERQGAHLQDALTLTLTLQEASTLFSNPKPSQDPTFKKLFPELVDGTLFEDPSKPVAPPVTPSRQGKKKLLKMHEVRFINPPLFDEIAVKHLYQDVSKQPLVKDYFPDEFPKGC